MEMTILFFILAAGLAQGQEEPDWVAILDEYLPQYMQELSVPGLAFSVVMGNQDGDYDVITRGYGVTSFSEYGQEVTEDTVFPIASLSKSFTAALMGKVLHDNSFTFYTPISEMVCPRIVLYNDERTNLTTPREMLAHAMGMPSYYGAALANFGSNISRYDLALRLQEMVHVLPFNYTFYYNDFYYTLAGQIIERLTGGTWEDAMRGSIFEPLGMDRTSYTGAIDYLDNAALPHVLVDGEYVETTPQAWRAVWNIGPACSIMTSASDMAKYHQFQLRNGLGPDGTQIVPEDVMTDTRSPKIGLSGVDGNDTTTHYCFGWDAGDYRGYERNRHSGNLYPFAVALQTLFPTENFAIFATANGATSDASSFLKDIHYFIQDSILFEDQAPENFQKFKQSVESIEGSTKEQNDYNIKNNKAIISKLRKDVFDENHIENNIEDEVKMAARGVAKNLNKNRQQYKYVGDFTHPALGTMTVSESPDSEDGTLELVYGEDIQAELRPSAEDPLQFSMFMKEETTFWHLTAADGLTNDGYSVTFHTDGAENIIAVSSNFIEWVLDAWFYLDAELPDYEEIPCQ